LGEQLYQPGRSGQADVARSARCLASNCINLTVPVRLMSL
jgi:hypothetical protein